MSKEITPHLIEGETLSYAKPRRGKIWRSYWLQSLGFVGFLVAVFLFVALRFVGN